MTGLLVEFFVSSMDPAAADRDAERAALRFDRVGEAVTSPKGEVT